MGLRIQNNVEAFNAHRQLNATASKASKAMEKLSSGYRINRAADDAAGLAISEKMRGQIGGLAQAQRNAQDGISLVQTAEGALTEVHSMLQRIRDLRVQFGNDTLSTEDRAAIRSEATALSSEIIAIRDKTQFNGLDLLDGTPASLSFQVGANDGETVTITTGALSAGAGMTEVVTPATYTNDANFTALSLADLDTAIKEVSTKRSEFGAVQNRLEHRLANLATYQ